MMIKSTTLKKWLHPVILLGALSTSSNAQTFQDKLVASGMGNAIRGHGVAAADYNNDGLIDLYFVTKQIVSTNYGGSSNILFKNMGNGIFIDAAQEAGVQGRIDTTANAMDKVSMNYGASWGDFDNDGDADLFLTNKGRNELYENNGDGTFTDITFSAGMGASIRESTSAAWFDSDRDGDLDLYVSNYGKYGPISSAKNEFYINNGDGTFTEYAQQAGIVGAAPNIEQSIQSDWTYSSLIIDANIDGWPDIYCVNDFGGNILFINKKNNTFREATTEFGLFDNGHGMGAAVGDIDNDGLFDIYLTNIEDGEAEWNPLFRHLPSGTYEDIALSAGVGNCEWAWGCDFFDFDLDGKLDLYVVNGQNGEPMTNRLFHNNGDGTFEDQSGASATNSVDESRGICITDLNHDGRPDIIAANFYKRAHLYINQTTGGNFLKIKLIGVQSNRDARGAIVEVETDTGTFYRANDGIVYLGQSLQPVHFGLGAATSANKIIVQWPTGTKQTFSTVAANRTIVITEGVDSIKDITTAIRETSLPPAPDTFRLLGSFPNPGRDLLKIQFSQKRAGLIRIEIFDILGRKISTVASRRFPAGEHIVSWNTSQDGNKQLANGMYLVRAHSEHNRTQTKTFLLMR